MSEPTPEKDTSEAFLDSLPELAEDETFVFACDENVPCFNRCCAELTLPLTPYDALRLRRHLETPGAAFLETYAVMRNFPDTGFPLPLLRMTSGPGEPCPFITPGGCAVYEDRPGACRAYPLGRGAKMGRDGAVVERFFVVREDHCRGFDAGRAWTARQWTADQGLETYNAYNDKYMRLMAMVKTSGRPISSKLASMCVLAFYQLDQFRDFLLKMDVLNKVFLNADRREAILEEDESRLEFAYDWMELVIFGQCPTLSRNI